MLYEKYEDEAAFRADFIRPLLTRMGYVSIAHLHGQHEFGKDFVFSELTPFGQLRYSAAVVKHERSISQGGTGVCQKIMDQVDQAYSVPFKLAESSEECHVSSVYVFNSGKITDNAKTWLRASLGAKSYGRNVHVVDGERLYQLNLIATHRMSVDVGPRLDGLHIACRDTEDLIRGILDHANCATESYHVRGFSFAPFEQYLLSPFLTDVISTDSVQSLVRTIRGIERVYNKMFFTNCGLDDGDSEVYWLFLERKCGEAQQCTRELCEQIAAAYREVKPLA